MDEKDKKVLSESIKKILIAAQEIHGKVPDVVKAAGKDKEFAKLAKDMETSFKPFHKAARAILDAIK